MGAQADFGRAITALGDIDGDSVADYAISGPGVTLAGNGAGAVRAYSGATGNLLWSQTGSGGWAPCGSGGGTTGDYFGAAMALVPDADGDGLDDLAVGAPFFGIQAGGCRTPNHGRLYVISSATGMVIAGRTRTGVNSGDFVGQTVVRVQDMSFDGVDDYAVRRADSVDLVSGASGAFIMSVPLPPGAFAFAGAGDFHGDGIPTELAFGIAGADSVVIIDVLVGTTTDISGPVGSGFGTTLVRDGDAVLIGAPFEAGSSGAIYRSSFPASDLTRLAGGLPGDELGASIAVGGNADLDLAADDILVGAPGGNAVVLIDENGALLGRAATAGTTRLGSSVAWLADLNLNGMTEFLAGDLTGSGRVSVLLGGLDATIDPNFGPGCNPFGPAPTLTASGPLRLGNATGFVLTGAPPFALCALYLGQASTTGVLVPPCTLWMNPTFQLTQIGSGLTSAAGAIAFAPLPVPVSPALIGFDASVQAAVLVQSGFATTNAVASTVGW